MEQQVVSNSSTAEADEELYGNIMDAWGFLKQTHQGLWELYQFEEGKFEALTKRQQRTQYGQEQGAKVEHLEDTFGNLMFGLGRLDEIASSRWGIELE
jgi:hypothetical protein